MKTFPSQPDIICLLSTFKIARYHDINLEISDIMISILRSQIRYQSWDLRSDINLEISDIMISISARVRLVGLLHPYSSSLAATGFLWKKIETITSVTLKYCGMVVGLDLALGRLVEQAKDILGWELTISCHHPLFFLLSPDSSIYRFACHWLPTYLRIRAVAALRWFTVLQGLNQPKLTFFARMFQFCTLFSTLYISWWLVHCTRRER